jgi:AcrR family transcriptional regulator
MPQTNHRRAKRQPLSPDRIVSEALALVDAEGLDAFSFRVLAKRLRCEAMSLYHYFPSKSHLFDAMLDSCLGEIRFAGEQSPWIEQLRHVAHQWRAMALRHPGFFPFMAVHRLNTRFALGVLNRVLAIFDQSAMSAEWKAKSFRAIGFYLMGAMLDETAGYAKGPTAAVPVSGEVVAREFPAVAAAGPYFAASHHEDTFVRGLETFLREAERQAAQAAPHSLTGTV